MAESRETHVAFVLDDERVAIAPEGGTIPGLPGVWRPGEPQTAEQLGLPVADLRAAVKAGDAPLKETRARAAKGEPLSDLTRAESAEHDLGVVPPLDAEGKPSAPVNEHGRAVPAPEPAVESGEES